MFAELIELFPKFNEDAEELERQNEIIEQMGKELAEK